VAVVAGTAIGQAHEPYDRPVIAPVRGGTAGLDVGVVGMGTDD
jgi:hypothetical protein